MTFASSSLVTLRAIKEASFGVTPITGNPKELRITGESLDFAISKETSKEINASRTVASAIPVSASASGNINAELSYKDHDDFFASALQAPWQVLGTGGVTTPVTVDVTAADVTAAVAPTGADAFTNLKPGQWFRLNSAGPNAGKILRVHPTTAPTATVITLDPNTPGVASTVESVKLESSRLTHGKTMESWTLERENSDIGVFMAYTGMYISKMNVNIQSGSLTSLTFDFMGKGGLESNATTLPGTPILPSGNEIHSGVGGATSAVWLDGAPISGTYVKSVSVDFDNSLRVQEAIGNLGAVGVSGGTINCTANASIYFKDNSLFTKFRTNQNVSLSFASTDEDGNGYIFTMPNVNISSLKSNASGKDQDQMLEVSLTALADRRNPNPLLRQVIYIDRIGTAA